MVWDREHVTLKAWYNMVDRCENEKCASYLEYGGRGITVDPRWKVFGNFLADMGYKPEPFLSLDRIDNDGPYTKDNCRWAPPELQAGNTRAAARAWERRGRKRERIDGRKHRKHRTAEDWYDRWLLKSAS